MLRHSPLEVMDMMKPTLLAALLAFPAVAAEVGKEMPNVELRDGSTDKATKIPGLGQKVLAVFYTDADVADMNDPLADALKAMKPDLSKYAGLGVVNLSDSKAPNFIIKGVVRGKIEKYKSTILNDPDRALAKSWGLGDCNNTSVVLIIDKNKKLAHMQRGEIRGKDIESIVALVGKLIAAPAADAAPAAAAAPAEPAAQPQAPAEPAPAAP
jgi:predicted transcriptional regulator